MESKPLEVNMKTENLILGLRAMDAYAKQECMKPH